ncbi:Kinesin-like protein KIF26A [Armadillidium nasatum]|uniref:Kinesin-like protein KIF26A n=1 Tax=Armadillidium nasatum TaxID=96803 RepID=A0A5N5SWM9_9CRUS|nr:Kinesin-like protein KIF26A [Armadillidium nasatum]
MILNITLKVSYSGVVGGVLPDILQAVLGGTDGCVMCFGGSSMGKTKTMVGSHTAESELGIMPTAISWLYQAISHLKVNKASRFSVRVSAVVVDAPGKEVSDVLGDFAQENETSPGALLRQGSAGLLSSVSELRAPFSEIAARYLDLALSARSALSAGTSRSSAGPTTLVFTLHIYQYTFDKKEKGRVVGGRSRLHLIDLGDLSGSHSESLSLSGLTSVLLALFNGHKYLPHKFNRLTQLLQEILGSVTCHAAMIVHISASPRHSQHTLATLQLASRIHRLRRKKIRGLGSSSGSGSSDGSRKKSSGGETSAGSSSVDFSSSEQSADTVIYIGGGGPGDSSDGEHPPIFFPHHIRRHRSVELPRLRSFEQLRPHTASPAPIVSKRPNSVSPTPTSRSVPSGNARIKPKPPPRHNSTKSLSSGNSFSGNPIKSGFFRHQPGVSQIIYPNEKDNNLNCAFSSFVSASNKEQKGLNKKTQDAEKQQNYKFYQQPNTMVPIFNSQLPVTVSTSCSSQSQQSQEVYLHNQSQHVLNSHQQRKQCFDVHNAVSGVKSHKDSSSHLHSSQISKHLCSEIPLSDEQWIDGPRISKSKVIAAKSKLCHSETWIDGPSMDKSSYAISYGFMDDHKKNMIEKWVENQTAQVVTKTDDKTEGQNKEKLAATEEKCRTNSTNTPSGVLNGEELNLESDVDTLSEDHSSNLPSSESKEPNLIEELERKNLIPSQTDILQCQRSCHLSNSNIEIKTDIASEDGNVADVEEDVCSQCQALEEESEELNSLLSCEEEECKRQAAQTNTGLATVVEEPELESAFGADDPIDSVSLLNNPQTDCEDTDAGMCSELENSDSKNESVPGGNVNRKEQKHPRQRVLIVKTADSSIQVCEEDILRAMSITPCPSEVTTETCDDHPLRIYVLKLERPKKKMMMKMEDHLVFLRPQSTEGCAKIWQQALHSEAANKDLRELANIHHLFSAFTRTQPLTEPESLFTPVISPIIDNQPQPKSLPVPSSLSSTSNTNNQKKKIGADAPSFYNDNEVSVHNKRREKIQTDLNIPLRQSKDKCTGTDENSLVSNFRTSSTCTPVHNYHSSETLIEDDSFHIQSSNVNTRLVNTPPSLPINTTATLPISSPPSLPLSISPYVNDKEENILIGHQVPFKCKSCELNNCESCDIILNDSTPNDNDSDCPSSVSIGRSRSKSSVKNAKNNNSSSSSTESKRNIFKIRENPSKSCKNQKLKSSAKTPDYISKNLIRSPSRLHSQGAEDFVEQTLQEGKKNKEIDDVTTPPPLPGSELKCQCSNSRHYPSRIDFSQGTSSSSSKEWGSSAISPLSPQICPSITPSGSGSKGIIAAHPMTTSGSLGTTQSLGESSGYESIPRDSECSSFSSSQESEVDDEHRRFLSQWHPTRPTLGASTSLGSTPSSGGEVDSNNKNEQTKLQTSFLRHLTRRSSSKTEAKLVSSTTWKYRCWYEAPESQVERET